MTIMSDFNWAEIAKHAGGLPIDARAEVEEVIRELKMDEGLEFLRVKPETRQSIQDAQKRLTQLIRGLLGLEESSDFRCFNTRHGDKTSLAEVLSQLEAIEKRLAGDEKRLSKPSHKGWQTLHSNSFFIRILEFRSEYLGIDAPTQAKETVSSGRFHKYLELCLALADVHANAKERAEKLRQGIDAAVESFQIRKADPIYSHEWDDLFPQTAPDLRKSSRFLNV